MVRIPYGRYGLDFSLVSDEDWCECWKHKWHINRLGYVFTDENGHWLKQHVLIGRLMGLNPNQDIDHRDRNPLNNQRSNLRNITMSANIINSKLSKANTSGVKGVTWNAGRGCWQAQIKIKRKCLYLGLFEKFEDAVAARIEAEEKYFPGLIQR